MGIFAMRSRPVSTVDPEAGADWLDPVRKGLPPRFEAVGGGARFGVRLPGDACAVAGTQMAKDGASLDETLEALGRPTGWSSAPSPPYDDVRAVARAWSDATLAYLHQLACEDPMTGLASLAHVRTRLSELYRGELRRSARVRDTHALVVAELPQDRHDDPPEPARAKHVLTRAMRLSDLGEAARTVFSGTETIGRLGPDRIVVVVERDDRLGQRVALLRRMARTLHARRRQARVWIEGLPSTDAGRRAAPRRARPLLAVPPAGRHGPRLAPCAVAMPPADVPRTWSRSSRSPTSGCDEPLAPDYNVAPDQAGVRRRRAPAVQGQPGAARAAAAGAHLGAGAVLGQGPVDRQPDDQRPDGDGGREAGLPARLRRPPLPAAGRRLLRVVPHLPADRRPASRASSRSSSAPRPRHRSPWPGSTRSGATRSAPRTTPTGSAGPAR